MESNTLDTIIENLFYILPLIHKKLLKIDPAKISCDFNISRLHAGIMGIINDENTLPISEIAKKLLIPKPQMTLLINQLVRAGMVERQPNKLDRRVSNITLTSKGKTTLMHIDKILKNNIRQKLSYFNERELEELSLLLSKLRSLGARLDTHGQ